MKIKNNTISYEVEFQNFNQFSVYGSVEIIALINPILI